MYSLKPNIFFNLGILALNSCWTTFIDRPVPLWAECLFPPEFVETFFCKWRIIYLAGILLRWLRAAKNTYNTANTCYRRMK